MFALVLVLAQPLSLDSVLAELRSEAKRLESYVATPLGREFIGAAASLPPVSERTLYQDSATKAYVSSKAYGRLTAETRKTFKEVRFDERFYYYTKYGSPLAYVRPFEILGRAGLRTFRGKRIADFGYGGVGPLRMIASKGGRATGIDVDSLLMALYSEPEDIGELGNGGFIQLVEGFFPSDPRIVEAVGGGYDVFLSKNTLKRGYIHPEQPVDKRLLVDLGVSDEDFCRRVHQLLNPGGWFLIYNLSPAQSPAGQPYKPWADGRCPFAADVLEKAGFELIGYDVNDNTLAREMGRRLGWDQGKNAMEFEKDLFAHYTLARRKR